MTADRHNDFDRSLRNKLDTFEPEVNPGLWDRIVTGLDEQAVPAVDKTIPSAEPTKPSVVRTSRLNRYWWAAAVLLIAGGSWLYNNTGQQTLFLSPQPSERMAQTNQEDDPYIGRIPGSHIQSDANNLSEDLKSISNFLAKRIRATEIKSQKNPDRTYTDPGTRAAEVRHTIEPALLLSVRDGDPLDQDLKELGTTEISRYVTLQAQTVTSDYGEDSGRAVSGAGFQGTTDPVRGSALTNREKPLSVSRLLNLMVAQVDKRSEKFVRFSSDDEGSLKVDLKLDQFRTASN